MNSKSDMNPLVAALAKKKRGKKGKNKNHGQNQHNKNRQRNKNPTQEHPQPQRKTSLPNSNSEVNEDNESQKTSESVKCTNQTKFDYKRDLKAKLEKTMERLTKEANELAEKAVKQNKMSLVVESNAMRKRVLDMEKDIDISQAKIRKLEESFAKW